MKKQTLLYLCFVSMMCLLSVLAQAQTMEKDSVSPHNNPATLQDSPIFPGCEGLTGDKRNQCFQEKIIRFINENFKYPKDAKELNYQGRIMIQFVIEKDGTVSEITILKGIFESLDQEAIRVISSLPLIQPAIQDGRPVRVRYTVPISCRIDEGNSLQKKKKKKANKKDIPHWK